MYVLMKDFDLFSIIYKKAKRIILIPVIDTRLKFFLKFKLLHIQLC